MVHHNGVTWFGYKEQVHQWIYQVGVEVQTTHATYIII
jgi:hypothetical protein